MTDTAFSVHAQSIGRLATAYERDNAADGEPVVEDSPDGRWSRPPAFESGGGGLVSTAEDYLAFAKLPPTVRIMSKSGHTGRLNI